LLNSRVRCCQWFAGFEDEVGNCLWKKSSESLPVFVLACALAAPYSTPKEAHHHHPNHCDTELHAKPNGIQWVQGPPPFPGENNVVRTAPRAMHNSVAQLNSECLRWKKRWYLALLVNGSSAAVAKAFGCGAVMTKSNLQGSFQ
jgi:hypothetical protein